MTNTAIALAFASAVTLTGAGGYLVGQSTATAVAVATCPVSPLAQADTGLRSPEYSPLPMHASKGF